MILSHLFGSNQNGRIMPKLNSDKQRLLETSIQMLNDIYEIAKKKEDTETMTAVSDRICLLYEKEVDIALDRRRTAGFSIRKEEDEDE